MASLADGAYRDWDDLAEVIKPDRVIKPDINTHSVYNDGKKIFRELYERNKDLMHI